MGIKIMRGISGLNPKDFLNQPALFSINNIRAEKKKSKDNREYTDYTLEVMGSNGRVCGDFEIRFLFPRDLNALTSEFGEDSDSWKGKMIVAEATKEGEYFRWLLTPDNEEKIK